MESGELSVLIDYVRVLVGRCAWSTDGVHFQYQTGPALITALLDGVDAENSCGAMGATASNAEAIGGCTVEEAKALPSFVAEEANVKAKALSIFVGGGPGRSSTLVVVVSLLLLLASFAVVLSVACLRSKWSKLFTPLVWWRTGNTRPKVVLYSPVAAQESL